jgi:hypothetical protein
VDGVERKPVRATVRRPVADLGLCGSCQNFSITDWQRERGTVAPDDSPCLGFSINNNGSPFLVEIVR